jgi:hypothetical protein
LIQHADSAPQFYWARRYVSQAIESSIVRQRQCCGAWDFAWGRVAARRQVPVAMRYWRKLRPELSHA